MFTTMFPFLPQKRPRSLLQQRSKPDVEIEVRQCESANAVPGVSAFG